MTQINLADVLKVYSDYNKKLLETLKLPADWVIKKHHWTESEFTAIRDVIGSSEFHTINASILDKAEDNLLELEIAMSPIGIAKLAAYRSQV